jgi:hypothetical protein
MANKNNKSESQQDLVVFSLCKPSACSECGVELFKGDFLRMEKGRPLCMDCADLGHLVFLPRGDVALTRRSRKHSSLSAVVVRFSRSRGRYERRGILVEEAALEKAERECLSDAEVRERARDRAAVYRASADARYVAEFAEQIRRRFPGCPPDEAVGIAKHACQKYSGRIGRSAGAKEFDELAIDLAVKAHVRHAHTDYDRLLARGFERSDARAEVAFTVGKVMDRWSKDRVEDLSASGR